MRKDNKKIQAFTCLLCFVLFFIFPPYLFNSFLITLFNAEKKYTNNNAKLIPDFQNAL